LSRTDEFYRGKRKRKGPALIGSIIVLTLLAFVLILFYGLQKFIVISNNGLSLEMPFLTGGSTLAESAGNEEGRKFAPVQINLEVGDPDYSNIKASAGEELTELRGIFVPSESVTVEGIAEFAARLEKGNTLVLEVKPASGVLAYASETDVAVNYGTAGFTDLRSAVKSLRESAEGSEKRDIYLVAAVSCCLDTTLASRYIQAALKTADGNMYTDTAGGWLDPCTSEMRGYLIALCKELAEMGFDEILFTNLCHPSGTAEYAYSSTSSVKQTPVTAVSGLALALYRNLRSTDVKLSVQLESTAALSAGCDTLNGQNAELFFKLFDRVYYPTTVDAAKSDLQTAANYMELGSPDMRFVPVTYGNLPATGSWVLRDAAASEPEE